MKSYKPYLRHLLLSRSNWMEERLYANAERNGYGDVTPAMSRLFAHLAGKPQPLSELARRLSVTRQAIHKLALEGARLGYVELVDSEQDARVKLLRFTAKGQDMARSAERELILIETELTGQIGAERLQLLKEVLALPWSPEELAKGRRAASD